MKKLLIVGLLLSVGVVLAGCPLINDVTRIQGTWKMVIRGVKYDEVTTITFSSPNIEAVNEEVTALRYVWDPDDLPLNATPPPPGTTMEADRELGTFSLDEGTKTLTVHLNPVDFHFSRGWHSGYQDWIGEWVASMGTEATFVFTYTLDGDTLTLVNERYDLDLKRVE